MLVRASGLTFASVKFIKSQSKAKIMNAGKVLLGILAGVAAGATLGILFAPDKGSSIRRKISQKSDDYAEELGDKFNEFIEGISKQFENVKKESTRLAHNGALKMEEVEAKLNNNLK